MNTITVQLRDRQWTLQALHLACAMAHTQQSDVTLVRMVPVQHMTWVGTDLANVPMSSNEHQLVDELVATAEDYGVSLCIQNMQYFMLAEALVEVAASLESKTVFATLPAASLPYWRRFQLWNLQRQLNRRNCQLYTLEQSATSVTQTPSVTIQPSKHSAYS
ncbi:MAG: hypothetical protein K8L91_14105 [Anaerolineae bacterium]|nr:hypothetical protein [Anaerolineae bacterium]